MSSLTTSRINRLTKEIADLRKSDAREAKKEADLLASLNRATDAARRTKSASTLQSKGREIERLTKDLASVGKKRADLSRKIADISRGDETVLTTTRGKAWTAEGFKASWSAELNREVMKTLRERQLVFHGLRKSAVVFLLEAGCTDAETAAITGQSRDMVEHYAKKVNQHRLATAAILKWETASEERKKGED